MQTHTPSPLAHYWGTLAKNTQLRSQTRKYPTNQKIRILPDDSYSPKGSEMWDKERPLTVRLQAIKGRMTAKCNMGSWDGRRQKWENGETRSSAYTCHIHLPPCVFQFPWILPDERCYYKIKSQMHSLRLEVTLEGMEFCMTLSTHPSLFHSSNVRFRRY